MENLLLAFAIGIFIAIYGGFHVYAYRKLRTVFPRHRRTVILVLLIQGLSIFIAELFSHGNVHSVWVAPLSWSQETWSLNLLFEIRIIKRIVVR